VVTGAYISVAGAALVARPSATLRLLFPVDAGITEPWTRLLGLLCLTFGSYYLFPAWLEHRGVLPPPLAFYSATVVGRAALAAGLAALVAFGGFPPGVLLLAALNALGAASMHLALSADSTEL